MHSRRWYEVQRQAAEGERLCAVASVHKGARDRVSGTAIPTGYPSRAPLLAAGYLCTEDLPDGSIEGLDDARDELSRAGIDGDDADALLTRLGFTLEET